MVGALLLGGASVAMAEGEPPADGTTDLTVEPTTQVEPAAQAEPTVPPAAPETAAPAPAPAPETSAPAPAPVKSEPAKSETPAPRAPVAKSSPATQTDPETQADPEPEQSAAEQKPASEDSNDLPIETLDAQSATVAPLVAGVPDGGTAPYVYWDVRDTAGNLVPGATFQFSYGSGLGWSSGTGLNDCQQPNCGGNSLDRDTDGGEFLLEHRGTPRNSNNRLQNDSRYRVRPVDAPAGYAWAGNSDDDRSVSFFQDWNDDNGAGTHSFGTFTVERAEYTITVKKGAYRTGTGANDISTENTAGVRFGLFTSATGGSPLFTCEIAPTSLGDCVFEHVTVSTDRNFYVRELAPAAGSAAAASFSEPITAFSTGDYYLRTGTLSANSSGNITLPGSPSSSTSGKFANRATNPKLMQTCSAGVDVAVLLDTSGSVDGYENSLARATTALVEGLTGTPSRVAMFSFASTYPGGVATHATPQSVQTSAGVTTVKNWYSTNNGQTANFNANGGTNWDMGLWATAQGAATHDYDIVFVLTDGNPTFSGGGNTPDGPGSATYTRELERAVFSANAIKKTGARVITVGIGSGLNDSNLASISGATAYSSGASLNDFDYIKSNWSDLEDVLEAFAQGLNCEATVTVEKQTKAAGSSSWTAASGWEFGFAQSGAQSQTPTATSQDTGTAGLATWTLRFANANDEATVTLTELEERNGWRLQDVTCTAAGAAIDLNARTAELSGIGIGENVTCTFRNAQLTPATVVVSKQWVIDGEAVAHGSQPDGMDATLSLDPAGSSGPVDWGQTRTGFVVGDTLTIGEATTLDPALVPGCVLTGSTIAGTGITGSVALASAGYEATLGAASNAYTVTNTVQCQRLTLVKDVDNDFGGTATSADWDGGLFAQLGADQLVFDSGDTQYVATGDYVLTEASIDGYSQDDLSCTGGTLDGSTVTVATGANVVCTFTNSDDPGTVTWTKTADDTTELLGGSVWTLTGPGLGSGVSVEDCIAADAAACTSYDKDPEAGAFLVEGLHWGDYTLVETSAPLGYVLDDTQHQFTVGSTALAVTVGTIVNSLATPPTLPLTGGLGADFYKFAGLGILLLGAMLFFARRIWMRKQHAATRT